VAMTPLWTGVTLWVCITLTMAPPVTAEVEDASVAVEDDEMDLEEDLTTFTKEGDTMYKALWKPRDCTGPAEEGDNVTMLIDYTGLDGAGREVELRHILVTPRRRAGLLQPCLGEKRRLQVPRAGMEGNALPNLLLKDLNWLDVEMVAINAMTFTRLESGLLLWMLEPVEAASCLATVEEGDTLAVEYEGSLEDGTVFDSSAARNAPFGPFVHGKGQIIQGYTEVLTGRCLGERWRMEVPPHLAYGDDGVGKDIPGGATLTFDVRLVKLNQHSWSDEVRLVLLPALKSLRFNKFNENCFT